MASLFPSMAISPNPASHMTTISYSLSEQADVTLEILDISGRKIKTLFQGIESAGTYSANWYLKDEQGKTVPSGIYFYRLKAGDLTTTKKMVLMR